MKATNNANPRDVVKNRAALEIIERAKRRRTR